MNADKFIKGYVQERANTWVAFAVGFEFAEADLPLSEEKKNELRHLVEQQLRGSGQVLRQEIQIPNSERVLVVDLPRKSTAECFGMH